MGVHHGGWLGLGPPTGVEFELNRNSPQAKGLVAWWPFLGSWGADAIRDRVGIYNLSRVSTPDWQADPEYGAGTACAASGERYLLDSTITLANGTPWSFVFRVQYTTGTVPGLIGHDFVPGSYSRIIYNEGLSGIFVADDSNDAVTISLSTALANGSNYEICVTDDGTGSNNIRVYVNGVYEGVGSNNTDDYVFTCFCDYDDDGGERWQGNFYEARLYDRALSAAEARNSHARRWDLYRPIKRYWAGATVGAVSALTMSVSDSLTLGESVTASAGHLGLSVSDALTLGESVGRRLDALLSVTDGLTLGETVAAAMAAALGLSVSDAITLGEAITTRVDQNISVSDALTLGESIAAALSDLALSVTDALTLGEAVTVSIIDTGARTVSVTDAVALGEAVTVALADLGLSVSDSLTLGESVTVGPPMVDRKIDVSDSLTLGESVIIGALALNAVVTDAIALGESVTLGALVYWLDVMLTDSRANIVRISDAHANRVRLSDSWAGRVRLSDATRA